MGDFWSDWRRKWGMIAASIGAVVMFAQLAGALETLEPYMPATHGWMRDWVQVRAEKRDAEIASLRKERDESIAEVRTTAATIAASVALKAASELKLTQDVTNNNFKKVFARQAAMQDTIYAGQLRDLRSELVQLLLADKDRPNDPIITGRISEITAQLRDIDKARADAACEQRQAENAIVRC